MEVFQAISCSVSAKCNFTLFTCYSGIALAQTKTRLQLHYGRKNSVFSCENCTKNLGFLKPNQYKKTQGTSKVNDAISNQW